MSEPTTPYIMPKYRYLEYHDKPLDQQVAALFSITEDVYVAMNGMLGAGPSFPMNDGGSAFSFMTFDP